MPQGLTRYYGQGNLHLVSFSCYHRIPFLQSPQARDSFVEILGQVRDRYEFLLLGYVIMPRPPSSRLSALPSFRTEQADFFFPFASCEWVGLRREKSLFDRASIANCHPAFVLFCLFPGLCIAARRSLIAVPPFPVAQLVAVDRTSQVYLMASKSGVLYVGVTSDLAKRIAQHKDQLVPGFTQKYNVTKLVWFEPHAEVRSAISREKEIKAWRRSKKVALIESLNPQWNDLSSQL